MRYRVVEIPGYPGYGATADGRIWSFKTRRFLKSHVNNSGAEMAQLYLNARLVRKSIGSLCLLAFVGPPGTGEICCHGSKGRLDHSIDNLSWSTHKQNNGPDRVRDGTSVCGEEITNAKLTEGLVREIRHLRRDGCSLEFLASKFNTSQSNISLIISNKRWKHVV